MIEAHAPLLSEESRLTRLFDRISSDAEVGRFHEAARHAECARRFAPDNPTVRHLLSRLLLLTGSAREAMETVRGLSQPESLLLLADAARHAGCPQEAQESSQTLLTQFCVDALPELRGTVSLVARAYRDRFPGWVGIDSAMRLVGEIRPNFAATIEGEQTCLGIIEAVGNTDDLVPFAVPAPAGHAGPLRIRVGSTELLGSGLQSQPNFRLAGWVVLEGHTVCGEARLGWAPQAPVTIVVSQGPREFSIRVDPTRRGTIGWVFSAVIDDIVHGPDLHVGALLPDGRMIPLVGSPLSTLPVSPARIETVPRRRSATAGAGTASQPINVVVPVYAGMRETLDCLNSVLATTNASLATITVVDDASPDPGLRDALDGLAATGRITLLRNGANLGFPGAANRGMRLHSDLDVVLLNSDTEVFDGWLERLRSAAYSAHDIGTVTPFGECAAIASYGAGTVGGSSSATARYIDRMARTANAGRWVDIPVGVGFCLYVRRSCLDEIGDFDEQGFGRGYGEETDFCLRARHAGWRHVAATDLFVRHRGGVSYGDAKQIHTARNARVINHRFPGYDDFVADFIARDPLRAARRAIDRRRLLDQAREPILLVSFELTGGVQRHVEHRQSVLRAAGHTVLVMRGSTSPTPWANIRVDGSDLAHLTYELPHDLPDLRMLLVDLRLVHIEIHHFLGLAHAALDMTANLGVPFRIFIHDYSWICPRVSLLNGDGVYCGEPAIEQCEVCVRTHGSALADPITVTELRERSGRLFRTAQRNIAATVDVRDRLRRHYPDLDVYVEAWELPHHPQRRVRGTRAAGPVRVALIGAIGTPKGYRVLLDCALDAQARQLPLEFVVIGYTRDDATLLATDKIFITGPYQESEAGVLLARAGCDIALFPSQTPETWCYSLTYALAEELRVVAFDIGAVAERLRAAGTGVLLAPGTSAATINDTLLRYAWPAHLVADTIANKAESIMQQTDTNDRASSYTDMAATSQFLTLPAGIYAFTVKSGGGSTSPLALPAVQVCPAPVGSGGSIDFFEGPATRDRWLTRPGDVVVVRITRDEATLLLTSLRAPDSSVLAIDVRRLDAPEAVDDASPQDAGPDLEPVLLLHVQNVGDLECRGRWGGRSDENLWIEALSHLVDARAGDVLEYCGVSLIGTQTGWLSGGELCGSRGDGIPLVAFGFRVKDGAAQDFGCTYSGRFLSGQVVGPIEDGRLCRSDRPNDPLVGIDLQLQKRPAAEAQALS